MTPRPLTDLVEPGWARALEPVAPQVAELGEFLRAEIAAGHQYLPAGENVLRAFTFPFDAVRVLIVGQDPYPTPGHAVGLSFSVAPDVRPVPRSLSNIFKEYSDDLGLPTPSTGDLAPPPADLVSSRLGRGDGLTPYGDDVLCGWLAVHRAAGVATDAVDAEVRAGFDRTTMLSATLLDCALHGEVIPEFAAYVASLGTSAAPARAALTKVGHSSGRGLLAGARLALHRLGHEGTTAA